MDEYLTVQELSSRIKMAPQTIYNKISSKKQQEFILGKHYIKPSYKKILFVWSEIQKWMKDKSAELNNTKITEKTLTDALPDRTNTNHPVSSASQSLIKI